MRLAHVSDPHLAPLPRPSLKDLCSKRLSGLLSWTLRRNFRHRREVLAAVLADIEAWRPDHVAVTGDLANLSLSAEFVRGAAWLKRFGPADRVSVVPGNHDAYVDHVWRIGWKLWAPWMSGDDGGTGFPWLRRRPPIALVGVSSAVPSPWFRATGRIGDDQLRALDDLLGRLAHDPDGLIRIILVHHPPLPEVPRHKALLDRVQLVQILARRGAELVLCGHTHRLTLAWLDGPSSRIPVLVAPSASLLASDAQQGGYLRLKISGRRPTPMIEVERRVFDPARRRVVDGGRLRLGVAPVGPVGQAQVAGG